MRWTFVAVCDSENRREVWREEARDFAGPEAGGFMLKVFFRFFSYLGHHIFKSFFRFIFFSILARFWYPIGVKNR